MRQALVSSTGTFWDTVVVCALTGLVLVTSIIRYPDINYTDGALLTKMAFSKISFSDLLSLQSDLSRSLSPPSWVGVIMQKRPLNTWEAKKIIVYYRILWIVGVFMGSVANLSMMWDLADTMNALMAIPNLISLLLLTRVLVKETNKYLWGNQLDAFDQDMCVPCCPLQSKACC